MRHCHTSPRNHQNSRIRTTRGRRSHLNLGWTGQPCSQLCLCPSADDLVALRERPTSPAVLEISMLLYSKLWRTFATVLTVAAAELLYSALKSQGIVRHADH